MSNKHKQNKGELALSFNRSVALKRSGLVKRGLQLIHELKGSQLRVLIGNHEACMTDPFCPLINKVISDKYDLKVIFSWKSNEILELAENHVFDVFILVLNNIFFYPEKHIKDTLQLVAYLKLTYGKPIITFSNQKYSENEAKLSGASFFFPLPFKPAHFMEAFEKCLNIRKFTKKGNERFGVRKM